MNNIQELDLILKESKQKLKDIESFIVEKKLIVEKINADIERQEKSFSSVADFVSSALSNRIDKAQFIRFLKKPYKIKQVSAKKYEIYVPKWVSDFQIGWLKDDDGDWLTYEVNQFSAWLGDIPIEIAEKLDIKPVIQAVVDGNKVTFKEEYRQKADELFKGHILKWDLDNATIKSGHEFDIILKIIQSGHIPYKQIPVELTDKRKSEVSFELLDHQKSSVKRFHQTGAVGVFHPTGAGKSFIAMYLMDELKGNKILVTKKTLIDQWKYYFEMNSPRLLNETDIVTYELLRNRPEYMLKQYVLAVFDECHRLPANSFARLALVNCKYRLGLSASPHREDGHEDMIIALTGYPEGLNWKQYMSETKRKYHNIFIHIVKSKTQKISKIRSLLDYSKKTIIYSDYLDVGKNIANTFNIPFIHGESKNRSETLRNNKVVVGSRVLDEGVSVNDLQRIIEVEFLYGSKQQEIQRTGRLMHSLKAERHDIIMTEKEFEDYGKRIWILEEKGFHVKVMD